MSGSKVQCDLFQTSLVWKSNEKPPGVKASDEIPGASGPGVGLQYLGVNHGDLGPPPAGPAGKC